MEYNHQRKVVGKRGEEVVRYAGLWAWRCVAQARLGILEEEIMKPGGEMDSGGDHVGQVMPDALESTAIQN